MKLGYAARILLRYSIDSRAYSQLTSKSEPRLFREEGCCVSAEPLSTFFTLKMT